MTKLGVDPKPLDYIDGGAVQRILDALGPKVSSSNVDKGKLAAELARRVGLYTARVIGGDRALAKDRERRMTNIRNAARQIISALNNDVWSLISEIRNFKESRHRAYPDKYPTNRYQEELRSTMERLAEDVGHWFDPPKHPEFWRVPSPPASIWRDRPRSPFEELVERLSHVFRKEFGRKPTFHRRASDNVPEGPVIRFVEHVLAEFKIANRGQPYSRESIAKALSDARTHRARKKSFDQAND
jgi:hypothetical protein